MKKGLLLLLLVSSVFVQAQSLKEALYGGKLKNKPGTVIRKGDDLTPQIDTTQKIDSPIRQIAIDTLTTKPLPVAIDSSVNSPVPIKESTVIPQTDQKDDISELAGVTAAETGAVVAKEAAAPKSNTVLWKEYIESVSNTLTTEVLPSKKIKRETYYVTVSYTIGTDGQTEIGDVVVSPENKFLQEQVKSRLSQDAPRLSPVLNSSGTPRKVNKRHNFTLTKE